MKPQHHSHKAAVRTAFDRAAPAYASAARVQADICALLGSFALNHRPRHPVVRALDGGCGTGFGQEILVRHYPHATHLALDFAPAMLQQLGQQHAALPICGDLEALPLADESIDLMWSSLALQWCDPAAALNEMARVLTPGGVAWLATLGPQTLWQLESTWSACGLASPRLSFIAAPLWQAAAEQAGFMVREVRNTPVDAMAPDLRGLLHQIRAIGAHRLPDARRAPLTRQHWQALQHTYESHRLANGLLVATYDVILLALERPL